jgi:hypothetical protein
MTTLNKPEVYSFRVSIPKRLFLTDYTELLLSLAIATLLDVLVRMSWENCFLAVPCSSPNEIRPWERRAVAAGSAWLTLHFASGWYEKKKLYKKTGYNSKTRMRYLFSVVTRGDRLSIPRPVQASNRVFPRETSDCCDPLPLGLFFPCWPYFPFSHRPKKVFVIRIYVSSSAARSDILQYKWLYAEIGSSPLFEEWPGLMVLASELLEELARETFFIFWEALATQNATTTHPELVLFSVGYRLWRRGKKLFSAREGHFLASNAKGAPPPPPYKLHLT